jgi:hypothetical protein
MTSILTQRRLLTLLAVKYSRNRLMPQVQSLFLMLVLQLACNDVTLKQIRLRLSSLKQNQISQKEFDASYPSESWQYTTKSFQFSQI